MFWKNKSHLCWLIPVFIAGTVYLTTMCRTVFVGDSGEFSLVFKTLGIAHPPGYPFFTLLGHIFLTLTAFLKPALSANLFSLLTSLAIIPAIFYLLSERDNFTLKGALVLLWAFSPYFWMETVAVEVYGFNLFLIALLAVLALGSHPRKWFFISYLFGLALAHHLTALSIAPALIYLYIKEEKKQLWAFIPHYLLLFSFGLSVYLYLPFRSSLSPIADWGHPVNLQLLWNHITAAQYQQAVAFSWGNLWKSLSLFSSLLFESWWWMGIILIIVGIWIGCKQQLTRTVFTLLILVANILLTAFYRIPDIDPYYLPALLACWLFMSEAIIWITNKMPGKQAQRSVMVITGSTVLLLLLIHHQRIDQSEECFARDYGKLILDSAVFGTVFTYDDNASFSAIYLRYAEGYRPEIEIYDRASRLKALCDQSLLLTGKPATDYFSAREVVIKNSQKPVHIAKCLFPYDASWYTFDPPFYSSGFLYSFSQPQTKSTLPEFPLEDQILDFKTAQMRVNLELCRGQNLLQRSRPDTASAQIAFQRALKIMEKEPRGALHNQLGISFRHLGFGDLSLICYDRALNSPRLTKQEREDVIFNISNIHKDRGNQYAAAGEVQKALEAFLKALEYDLNNSGLLYNIGVIYINYLHSPQKGKPYLQTYLKINPSDDKVKKLLESLPE